MPPLKQVQIPDFPYSHGANQRNFDAYAARYPLVFDKKVGRSFAELYQNALQQLEMVALPCFLQLARSPSPVQTLHFHSVIPDVPSCKVISCCLQEATDVQNLQFTDCKLSYQCVQALLSFQNAGVQQLTFVGIRTEDAKGKGGELQELVDLEALLSAICLGQNRFHLRFLGLGLTEKQLEMVQGAANGAFGWNIVGLGLPDFDADRFQIPRHLKALEIFKEVKAPELERLIRRMSEMQGEEDLEELAQTVLTQKLLQGTLQNSDAAKTYFQQQMTLARLELFKELRRVTLSELQARLEARLAQFKKSLTHEYIISYLLQFPQADELGLLLQGTPARRYALEFLHTPLPVPGWNAQIGVLKIAVIGDVAVEAPK